MGGLATDQIKVQRTAPRAPHHPARQINAKGGKVLFGQQDGAADGTLARVFRPDLLGPTAGKRHAVHRGRARDRHRLGGGGQAQMGRGKRPARHQNIRGHIVKVPNDIELDLIRFDAFA